MVAPLLTKFAETLKVFIRQAPDPRALWASRRSEFRTAHAVLPSTATTGEELDVTVQAWDRYERLVTGFDETLALSTTDPDAAVPDAVAFDAGDDETPPGVARATVTFETPGVQYLLVERDGERFVSNPVRVHESEPDERVYWGDLHLHSQFSDGAGGVEKGLRFGRDVVDLDVVAYTDHDTMGFFIPPQLQRRRMHARYFDATKDIVETFDDPGEFVTLFGYEWTKQPNVGGHVNVYFDGVADAELLDSLAPETNSYEDLWAGLRAWRDRTGGDAVTVPHHPAEAMYPFDFSAVEYDDEMAPLVEVYSQWGSSERPGGDGNRHPLAMGQGEVGEPGHYVQDALAMGHRVGMLASSDYHGPQPGHSLLHADPHLPSRREWWEDGLGWATIWRVWNENSYPGGLVAFRAPELTREAVFDALRARRVYGTTQPHRILVDFAVEGVAPGDDDSTVVLEDAETPREVSVDVAGTEPIEAVTVVKNNEPWHVLEGTDDPDAGLESYTLSGSVVDDDPVTGVAFDDEQGGDADVYYVRVLQAGEAESPRGMAWAGPVWVEEE